MTFNAAKSSDNSIRNDISVWYSRLIKDTKSRSNYKTKYCHDYQINGNIVWFSAAISIT